MNKYKILTIVVPSYNTKRFMDKSLPTYVDERLKDKIEVLLINDGSTDDTLVYAKKYELANPQIFRVISKENGGHGSVINLGIKEASGKYFKVVDGDDWVLTENLVKFVHYLENSDADIVISPYYTMDVSRNYTVNLHELEKLKNLNGTIDVDEVIDKVSLGIHGYTIKTNILVKNKIHLTEKCFYDDFQFVTYPTIYSKTIAYYGEPIVNYLIGQKSQSVSNESVYKNRDMHKRIVIDSIHYFDNVSEKLSDSKRAFLINENIRLIRSNYNIFVRNYKKKNVGEELHKFNCELNEKSRYFFEKISGRYRYINILQKENIVIMRFIGFLFEVKEKFVSKYKE